MKSIEKINDKIYEVTKKEITEEEIQFHINKHQEEIDKLTAQLKLMKE